jgi:acetylornithine deacetylase
MKFSTLALVGAVTAHATASFFDQIPFFRTQDLSTPLIKLHKDLVEIESISANEHSVGQFLKGYLESKNFTVELSNVGKGRDNVYAYVGKKRETKVLLTSHIDTVPPYIPYSVKGGKIYGRGTVDAKSCVAAMTIAVEELLSEGKVQEGDASLLFVVDEEVHGTGMKFANEKLGYKEWDSVIFGEPTEMKLGVGHKGILMVTLTAHGKAAHSGYPELGVSATETLIAALSELLNSTFPKSDLLGPTTVNIGKISGGVAANVLPAEASATIAVRVASDLKETNRIVYSLAKKYGLETSEYYGVEPQYLDYQVDGFESIILAYSTDIPNLKGSFKRYLYGPGSIHVAHGADEHVPITELEDSVRGYKALLLHSL